MTFISKSYLDVQEDVLDTRQSADGGKRGSQRFGKKMRRQLVQGRAENLMLPDKAKMSLISVFRVVYKELEK
jgi:hypothetical protein